MAQERRGSRSGDRRPSGDRSRGGKPEGSGGRSGGSAGGARSGGKPDGARGAGGPERSAGAGKGFSKDGKPGAKGGARGGSDARPSRDGASARPARDGDRNVDRKRAIQRRDGSGPAKPAARRRDDAPRGAREERTVDQLVYDGPPIPEGVTGAELDRAIGAQLRGLPDKLAMRIAQQLVAATMYIESDPELAYQFARAAKARTQRLAVIREALGEAAYAAGHYAEALAELRAAKRMNGATAYLPIMADCHRALGHPEDAVRLARSASVANFAPEAKAEMTIVEAGARRDMGHLDAALRVLELAPLNSRSRASWVVRLRYAYADTLEAAGRDQDALAWFHRTQGIDHDEITDSADRADAIEKRMG